MKCEKKTTLKLNKIGAWVMNGREYKMEEGYLDIFDEGWLEEKIVAISTKII